jgi:hypothetical protein
MIAMALILLAVADATVELTSVHLEPEDGGLVLRLAVSGPVLARVDRDGRDLLVALPGVRPAPGLALPAPVAEIQALAVEETEDGSRMRIRLESPRRYDIASEPGRVSVAIRPLGPSPSPRGPESVKDLYAKILPPVFGTATDTGAPGGEPAAPEPEARDVPAEGLHFGPVRFTPSVLLSYIDADSAILETAEPVRDRYFQIEPRLTFDVGSTATEARRLNVTYTPRYRMGGAYEEIRRPTHLVTAALEAPVGPLVALRAGYHYARGVLETIEVDPGREFFFPIAPFTRHVLQAGATLNSSGLLGLDLDYGRDSVHIDDEGGFFDHRTDALSATANYRFGSASRAYLRYTWSHVPSPEERPIAESTSSTVSLGVSGQVLPLVTGTLTAGLQTLDAPQAAPPGDHFTGPTLTASLRKEFTPSFSLGILGRRDTYPSDFEGNAFYVATGFGLETDVGLPLSLSFHGAVGWQRNAYRLVATGLGVPREDEIVGWSVGLGRSLTRWSFLRADYRQDNRSSNVPTYDSDSHSFVIQLGLGYIGAAPAGVSPR